MTLSHCSKDCNMGIPRCEVPKPLKPSYGGIQRNILSSGSHVYAESRGLGSSLGVYQAMHAIQTPISLLPGLSFLLPRPRGPTPVLTPLLHLRNGRKPPIS
ncbi:mCG147950 [Mus musculus]|nr:mCG147950 [Mus musculus]